MTTKQTGFTLIEMLTVVLIVGLLTAVALPQYRRVTQKAQATEAVAMLRVIRDSAERLASDFGYRTFKAFSSDSTDKAKANFQRMDMFNKETISCTFNTTGEVTYTEMTCAHFKYFLNKGGDYIYAKKLVKPYKDTEIRLYWEDIPRLSCVDAEGSNGCDLYNIDTEPEEEEE